MSGLFSAVQILYHAVLPKQQPERDYIFIGVSLMPPGARFETTQCSTLNQDFV